MLCCVSGVGVNESEEGRNGNVLRILFSSSGGPERVSLLCEEEG